MFFAIAALLFHIGPAVPAAAATAAKSAASAPAPAPTVMTLPNAPLPSLAAPSTTAAAPNSSRSSVSASDGTSATPSVFRLAALDSAGNNTQTLSTIHIPEQDAKPFRRIGVEEAPSRRNWLALSIIQSGAATFDAYATRQAIENGAHEADPFMRPFANSSGIYAAIQVCPLVLDYTARHMQRSENPVIRHTWWLPQALGTGLYIFSGAHDLQVASHH
ncbi:MAG TPA: hypothetical protein VJS43_11585 [Candidatus Acidoferrales bacterium]|nr:hypothetical protein [Candidatus Acidoferrales bacterium]